MRPVCVVEVDPLADDAPGRKAVGDLVQVVSDGVDAPPGGIAMCHVGGVVNAKRGKGRPLHRLLQVDRFVFERAPQPLDEDVVHATAAAVDRDADPGRLQAAREDHTGEPAALVGVDDRRRAVARQGLLQRVRTEAHIQRVRQPPSQHVAACPVHDRHRVEEAAAHRDESNVGAPDEVRPFDRQAT